MVKRLFVATLVAISPLYALAQGLITGHITDARNGESLIGASVIVKSEKGKGVVTDIDGNFSLQTKVEPPLTLRVEYVGYRPLDVDVYDFEEPVEIQLIDNANRLNEVVVVGYGAQKRLELTSSISSVGEELLKQQNTSVESALQGAVAGLNVTTTSGQPGAASIIRIRGGNSITGGNEPLYVIDGFIVYNDPASTRTGAKGNDATLDPLAFLNPSDIASIEVLKDVSATAIYGTRGANGISSMLGSGPMCGMNSMREGNLATAWISLLRPTIGRMLPYRQVSSRSTSSLPWAVMRCRATAPVSVIRVRMVSFSILDLSAMPGASTMSVISSRTCSSV